MRWLAVWLLLLGVYLAIWSAVHGALSGSLAASAEDLAHLLLIPAAQVAALAVMAAVRRHRRGR